MAERMNNSAAEAAKKVQEAIEDVGTPVAEIEISLKTDEGVYVESIKDGSVVEYASPHRLKVKIDENGRPTKVGASETGTIQKMYALVDPQAGEYFVVEIKTAA